MSQNLYSLDELRPSEAFTCDSRCTSVKSCLLNNWFVFEDVEDLLIVSIVFRMLKRLKIKMVNDSSVSS